MIDSYNKLNLCRINKYKWHQFSRIINRLTEIRIFHSRFDRKHFPSLLLYFILQNTTENNELSSFRASKQSINTKNG